MGAQTLYDKLWQSHLVEQRDDGSAVLRVRVKAVPDRGKANAAVVALVARSLGVPKSAVTLVAGDTARLKTLSIAGGDALARAVDALVGQVTPPPRAP